MSATLGPLFQRPFVYPAQPKGRRYFHATPSTTISSDLAVRWRNAFAALYSSDAHHCLARAIVGNSSTTTRLGCHEPSSVSHVPPLTANLPPYAANDDGTIFLYSSY